MSATAPASAPLWRRAFRWWFAVEPMRHAPWEMRVMRCIIGGAALLSLWNESAKTGQPQPNGLAVWGFDFTWMGNDELYPALRIVWIVCLALYVCGIAPVLALLPPLIGSIGMGTLGNSNGAIGHTTQILTVALFAQWLAYAWAALQPRTGMPTPHRFDRQQLAMDWGRQAVAATYVVSAFSKLVESKGDWISDTPYFGLQVVKSTNMGFYDHLAPRIDGYGAWLGQWFVDHPHAATVILGAALPLELLAFLALNNRRIALIFGATLYFFHSTVTEVMQLGFLYHKLLLLALFINPAWWLVQGTKKWLVPDSKPGRGNQSEI